MVKENSSFSLSDVYKKENRRRRRIILGIVVFLIYGAFLGGAWLVVYSPLFRIQNREVKGNKSISSDEILALVRQRITNDSFWKRALGVENILAWPENLSSDDLRIIPELKGLSMEKDYKKRSVVVAVEERRPFAVWCLHQARTDADNTQTNADNFPRESAPAPLDAKLSNGVNQRSSASDSCWWFDNEGVLFAKALKVEGNLITVVNDYSQKNLGLGSNILPSEFIPNIFSIFKVTSGGDFSVKEIRLNDIGLQEIEVDTYAAPKLYFSLRFPADNTLAVIQSLKNQPGLNKLQYIDFRLENRAYYK